MRFQGLLNRRIEYAWLMEFLFGNVDYDICLNNIQCLTSFVGMFISQFSKDEYNFLDPLKGRDLQGDFAKSHKNV